MKRLALFLFALALTACGARVLAPAAPTNDGTTFSIQIHVYDAIATSPAGLADIANNLHATAIRVEYSPTQYSYAWAAQAISDGLKIDFGLPFPTIVFPNGPETSTPAQYAAMCSAGAAQFPGEMWEIMNEADLPDPSSKLELTPAEYVQYVQTCAPAIQAADPTAMVVTAGTSGLDTAWLTSIAAAFPSVNGIAVHPYGVALHELFDANNFRDSVTRVGQQFGKPVYVTEWGEAPPNPSDLQSAISQMRGTTPFFNVYEYETVSTDAQPFGLVNTPGYAAFASAALPQ